MPHNTQSIQPVSESARKRKDFRVLWLVFVVCLLVVSITKPVDAQASWDTTPYKVSVWIALQGHPKLTAQLYDEVSEAIAYRTESVFGYAWQTETAHLPESLNFAAIHLDEPISEAALTAANGNILKNDKLFVVTIQIKNENYQLSVREFDCRTRLWSVPYERQVFQASKVSSIAFQLLYEAFSPIVRIGRAEGKIVAVTPRAGQLVTNDRSPVLLRQGMVLQPVIRRNDRRGDPRPGGILIVPWTLLHVTEKMENEYHCEIHSGMRSPLGGQRSIRTDRLAMVIDPRKEETRIVIQSRDQESRPLVGYDVLRRIGSEKKYQFIARTDRQGAITIPAGESPFEILYIRNGSQLLARLPIVPGRHSQLIAKVADDDLRLEAEGFLKGFQDKLIDLVARRQILAARIKRRIQEERYQEADKLLEQFRSLATQADLSRQIQIQRQRFNSDDSRLQNKLNLLFTETHRMLQSHLDPQDVNRLSSLLAKSRR